MTPELNFTVAGVDAPSTAASPQLVFALNVTTATSQKIHTVILRCQIMLETAQRRYSTAEQRRLADLFGEADRWSQTLRSMLWTNTSVVVPPFCGSSVVDLPVPCTFDFNVAATKYFAGIDSDEVPVSFFFNGTVFYEAPDGNLQAGPISWEKESSCRLPIRLWRDMMDVYYPNCTWLCLRRDAFNKLYEYKVERGLPSFDDALLTLLNMGQRQVL
jgi:uncharacterized protein DUF6084